MKKGAGKITKARKEDVPLLIKIFNNEKGLNESLSKYNKNDVLSFLFEKNNKSFIYRVNGELAGVITGTYWKNSIAMLHQLLVRKKYRGLGIGIKLLRQAENYAKKNKIKFIYFYSFPRNKEMHGLAEKFNYKRGTKVCFFYKDI